MNDINDETRDQLEQDIHEGEASPEGADENAVVDALIAERDQWKDRALRAVAEAGGDVEAERARLVAEYEETLVNPWDAAERGYIDAVISPSETRVQVVRALRALATKRAAGPAKKHGNIPL